MLETKPESEILPIWKPVGFSTHIIAKKVSEKFNVPTSHTGTLDPMAEGVIIILLGETRHKKYDFAAWKKTYEFEMVFGVSTDTYDSLGLITQVKDSKPILKDALEKTINDLVGDYSQTVPPFSAIKIKGKPLHWYALNNKINQISLPLRSGQIYSANLIDLKQITVQEMVNNISKNISKLKADLRQEIIIPRWESLQKANPNQKFQLAKISVEMSKGLYVRSLCTDIAIKHEEIAFVYSLKRTENGNYSKENSYKLNDLFKEDLDFYSNNN